MIKSPVEIGSAIVIFSQPRLARGVLAFGSKNTISDKKKWTEPQRWKKRSNGAVVSRRVNDPLMILFWTTIVGQS